MTTLVLGTVGSMVGGAFGGAIGAQVGWLVGSLLGNLIDPPKVEGPRRSDLKLQVSEYGKPIPIVWGTGRIAGNVIDQTDLQEHKETEGGKGGPEITKYTYSASFAILLCEGPIKGVKRIWADGRLIWAQSDGTDMPCTLYLGDETQEPDPTFEAIHGIGNQPAYRGMAYVVFADYMLTDFGDRIPMLEFEVYTEEGTIPWRVVTFSPWADGLPNNYVLNNGITYDGLIIATGITNTGNADLVMRKWKYDGTQVGDTVTFNTGQQRLCAVYNSAVYATLGTYGGGGDWIAWWRYIPEEDTFREVSRFDVPFIAAVSGASASAVCERATLSGDYIYCLGHQATNTVIYRVPYNNGTPGEVTALHSTFLWYDTPGNIQSMASTDGHIYYMHQDRGGPDDGAVRIWKFDEDLNLIHFWDVSDTAGTMLQTDVLNGFVWHNLIVVATSEGVTGGGIS